MIRITILCEGVELKILMITPFSCISTFSATCNILIMMFKILIVSLQISFEEKKKELFEMVGLWHFLFTRLLRPGGYIDYFMLSGECACMVYCGY